MRFPKASVALPAAFAILGGFTVATGQTITGVSGTASHGSSFVIQGSSFATKPQAAPVVWDNLESGRFSSAWQQTGSPGALNINTDNQRHGNSQFNTMTNFVGAQAVEHATFTGGSNSPKWYCQYWFKLGSDWNWGTKGAGTLGCNLANVKLFRMWSSGSALDNWGIGTEGWSNSMIYKSSGPINESGWFAGGYIQNWAINQWHLLQIEYKDSSQRGVRDGAVKVWMDGALILDDQSLLTRSIAGSADGEFMRPYGLGFFNSWSDASTDGNHFYMDDAYIDNTWARVELGNAATLASCTHREIQPLVSWSDTQIESSFNAGSFSPGSTAYLFVVNANGTPSPGYMVTIGGTATSGPGQPGKPVF